MPIILPNVPTDEHNVRTRIRAKFDAYRMFKDERPAAQTSGELYEIAVALRLFEMNKFTDGNQISRWESLRGAVGQDIKVGDQEYDFVLPSTAVFHNFRPHMHVGGRILVEAKSYHGGLDRYIRKALSYCLADPTNLGGMMFVTPASQESFFRPMITCIYDCLATPATGRAGWVNCLGYRGAVGTKPSGEQIRAHFQQYAGTAAQAAKRPVGTIVAELAQHAGLIAGCYQVLARPEADIATTLRRM